MMTIRPYQPEVDGAGVFALWQASFDQTWPLTRVLFRRVTIETDSYRDGDHFVAEEAGTYLGFVATQARRPASPASTGHIGILLVDPARRRQGIGHALHDTALAHLREAGVRRVQLGAGTDYLWPGVPSSQQPALAFFSACGWAYAETTYDLVQDLRHYSPPPALYQRIKDQGISLEIGSAETAGEALIFVAREFPSWEASYRSVAALGDYADFLLARDKDRQIIGAVLLYTALSHPTRLDVPWKTLLGEDAGAIGAVGVAAAARGRGTAHALVARGSEILRDRRARLGFIGWAWMIGLYGELGYQVWREYKMSRRDLP